MEKKNSRIQIEQSIIFNMQQQFISKYSKNTLVKNTFGYEQVLYLQSNEGQLLDYYIKNFRLNNNEVNWSISMMIFFSEYAESSIKSRYLDEIINNRTINLISSNKKPKVKLVDALALRKSSRQFALNYEMTIDELANLLNLAFANQKSGHRPYASGGGLYPISLYLYVNNVKDLKEGFYKYQPFSKSLYLLNEETINIEKIGYLNNFNLKDVKIVLFYAYNTYINRFKYCDQSLILASLETGMMMQNIQLLSASLGLGVCDLGGYETEFILEKLYLNQYFSMCLLNVTLLGGYKYE